MRLKQGVLEGRNATYIVNPLLFETPLMLCRCNYTIPKFQNGCQASRLLSNGMLWVQDGIGFGYLGTKVLLELHGDGALHGAPHSQTLLPCHAA